MNKKEKISYPKIIRRLEWTHEGCFGVNICEDIEYRVFENDYKYAYCAGCGECVKLIIERTVIPKQNDF